jgi:hypothetical protein
MAKPKDRGLDRHTKVQRVYRDEPDQFAAQDAAARAEGVTWTEWVRRRLRVKLKS